MYHIVLEITASNGIKSKVRVEQEETVTPDDIETLEERYTDRYCFPENMDAVVINVFHTPEESN